MKSSLPNLSQVAAFLAKRNWTEKTGKRRLELTTGDRFSSDEEIEYRIFEHSRDVSDESVRIILPVRKDRTVGSQYIESALRVLANFYETTVDQLAVVMALSNVDVFLGIHPRNTVSLTRAHEIITNLKNLVTQAANAELDPKPYIADAKGNKIVNDVNFGHTFTGSFGFRIECPLSDPDRQVGIDGVIPVPLERRLLQRLAVGFLAVEAAHDTDDFALICDGYRTGMTANICDAILELCEPSDLEPFTFQFEWSSLFPLAENLRQKEMRFRVNARRYALIQEASAALKQMVVESKTKLVGTVVALSSEVSPIQRGLLAHRKVTVLVAGGDYEDLKMQFEVSDQDYQLAIAAHSSGQLVEVEGLPVQRGTHWRIEDHGGLYLVGDGATR